MSTVVKEIPAETPAQNRAPVVKPRAQPPTLTQQVPLTKRAPAATAPAPPVKAPAPLASAPWLHWPLIWTVAVGGLIAWGSHAQLERYITPQRGLGYALGITGGSLMLLLLMYSARKRVAWLRWLGGIPAWFEFHMVLGVVGPVLVLFHANFSLGATNSNVALISMLLVAGSGVVGRYIYTRLHARLESHEDTLEQLKAFGVRLRSRDSTIMILPGVLDEIERVERKLIEPPKGSLARVLHLSCGALRIVSARWLVHRAINDAVQKARQHESMLRARHARRFGAVARQYAYRRLDAGRRTTEFKAYSRLFSFWHILHIPLFFMLLIAGLVHVIAINVY